MITGVFCCYAENTNMQTSFLNTGTCAEPGGNIWNKYKTKRLPISPHDNNNENCKGTTLYIYTFSADRPGYIYTDGKYECLLMFLGVTEQQHLIPVVKAAAVLNGSLRITTDYP